MTIPKDHLRACRTHEVVGSGGSHQDCPCCQTGVEARPGAYRAGRGHAEDLDMRWQINPDVMVELLPLLVEDAEEAGEGPVFVSVAEVPEETVRTAAGYTAQERWFNVVGYEVGNNTTEFIVQNSTAKDAIDAIESGEGYIEPPEWDFDRLDPEEWVLTAERYTWEAEAERVDEDTLRVEMGGDGALEKFPSETAYKKARRELGIMADSWDLSIRTIEAGGKYQKGIVEVSK